MNIPFGWVTAQSETAIETYGAAASPKGCPSRTPSHDKGGTLSTGCCFPNQGRHHCVKVLNRRPPPVIAHEPAAIANSLWTATATPSVTPPPLMGESEADVAIIGGGYTGLSAALHMAEAGLRVTLLEAETPGWGASGRNGGQVNPGLKDLPDEIEARFGPVIGARMVALSGGAPGLVFDLIRRHGIACDPVETGWLQPVHNAASLAAARDRAAQWARRGVDLRLLDSGTDR